MGRHGDYMEKIAFILQDLTGGGAERTVANLSFELSNNYDFYIIVYNGKNVSYPHKAKIIDLKLPPKRTKIGKLFNIFKRVKAVKKIKKQYKFDYTISFMFGANIVNVLSKQKEKIITSARNYMSIYGLSYYKKCKERFADKRADKVVAISKMVKYDLINNFNIPDEKIVTIYNPCDIDRIKIAAGENTTFVFEKNKFYFVNIGRLVNQKGQWNLLKSFSILSNKFKNVELIILGTGPLENDLKKLTKELKIDTKVHFLGFVDNPFAYLAKSNVFVLSSLHEGLGNVILEALACELPIISTDCFAGPREILAPDSDISEKTSELLYADYGVLVPEFSSSFEINSYIDSNQYKMAEAMEQLYTNKTMYLKYKKNSIKRIKDFDPKKIANDWVDLLKELRK